MVSFVCDNCQDTLKKAKVKIHVNRCYTSSVSCVDCGVSFNMKTYNSHNQCMTEKKKYAGELAQERISKQKDDIVKPAVAAPVEIIEASAIKLKEKSNSKKSKKSKKSREEVENPIEDLQSHKKKKKKLKKDKLKDIIKK